MLPLRSVHPTSSEDPTTLRAHIIQQTCKLLSGQSLLALAASSSAVDTICSLQATVQFAVAAAFLGCRIVDAVNSVQEHLTIAQGCQLEGPSLTTS